MVEVTRVGSTAADEVPCRSSDSYRLVFDAHRAGLARFAYLLGCESHQVDDVVAEAFLVSGLEGCGKSDKPASLYSASRRNEWIQPVHRGARISTDLQRPTA
jgi:DNA-directed RNA polymerase specialized sigma24 family protein